MIESQNAASFMPSSPTSWRVALAKPFGPAARVAGPAGHKSLAGDAARSSIVLLNGAHASIVAESDSRYPNANLSVRDVFQHLRTEGVPAEAPV
jgi:hypothetical protein